MIVGCVLGGDERDWRVEEVPLNHSGLKSVFSEGINRK